VFCWEGVLEGCGCWGGGCVLGEIRDSSLYGPLVLPVFGAGAGRCFFLSSFAFVFKVHVFRDCGGSPLFSFPDEERYFFEFCEIDFLWLSPPLGKPDGIFTWACVTVVSLYPPPLPHKVFINPLLSPSSARWPSRSISRKIDPRAI